MRTRRRILIALCGASLVAHCRIAAAQAAAKVHRIGWLVSSVTTPGETYRQFVQRATQLGYVEGRTFLIDYRSFDTLDEGKALAAELVRLKVDLIVAQAPRALLAARSATQTVPIVTFFIGDPVRMGIAPCSRPPAATSPASPLTLAQKWSARGWRSRRSSFRRRAASDCCGTRKTTPVRSTPGIGVAREHARVGPRVGRCPHTGGVRARVRPDGTREGRCRLRLSGPFTVRHRPALSAALRRYRLPAIWGSVPNPLQGAVVTFSANVDGQPHGAAEYMDRILKGAAPGELPFQQPTKSDLIIHANTARELGVPIPRSLLVRANRVDEQ